MSTGTSSGRVVSSGYRNLTIICGIALVTVVTVGGLFLYKERQGKKLPWKVARGGKKTKKEEAAGSLSEKVSPSTTTSDTSSSSILEKQLDVKETQLKKDSIDEIDKSATNEDPAILAKNKGNRLYLAKKYDEAIECYNEAIQLAMKDQDGKRNPNSAVFYCNRAACHAALNQHEKVLEDCHMALKQDRNYAKAYMRRAVALEALGKQREAAIDYSAVFILENFKNETAAQGVERTLGYCSRELTNKKMEERKFRLPSSIFVHFYFMSYKHYPGHEITDEELRAAERRLIEEPNDVETLFVRAKARIAHHRYEEAYSDLERCLSTEHEHLHEAYNLYAIFQYLDGSLEKAIEYFDQAIKLKPDWSDPYIRRSHVLAEKGDLQGARENLQRAIELDPTFPDVWYNRGQIHMIAGDFQEAVADYDKAISLYAKLPFAYVQLAVARYRLGSITTALETFEKATKLFPKISMIYNYYAELLIDQQRYDEALQKLDRAIELEPNAPMAYVNKSILLLQSKNDIEAAIQVCRRAISVDHQCDIAYGHLGQIYMQQGKYDLAIDNFSKAIENIRSEPELFTMIQCREAALCQQETLKLLSGSPMN